MDNIRLRYVVNARMPTEKAHGVQIAKMCEAYAKAGLDVELIVPKRNNSIKESIEKFYGLESTFRVTYLPTFDFIGKIPYAFLIQTLSFFVASKIYLLFKKYEILYTRDYFIGIFFRDYIYEVHYVPERIQWFHKMLWKRAQAIIPVTKYMEEIFENAGVASNSIYAQPNGIDVSRFSDAKADKSLYKELNLNKERKIVGYIGKARTMGSEKGVEELISSMAHLHTKDKSYVLLLVGLNANELGLVKSFCKKAGLPEEGYRLVTHIPHAQVPQYLKMCNALVMYFPWSRHYAYYMCPVKTFEYMASGVPFVTSDLPSIRLLLDDGMATLINFDAPEKLENAISDIFGNPEAARVRSINALKHVLMFTWDERAGRILRFLKSNFSNSTFDEK